MKAASELWAAGSLEERVLGRLRWRILPFVMLLYFASFLDRVNVGFAAFGMNKALGLTPAEFGFGAGVFFLGYVLFQVPANLTVYRIGARVGIACVVVVWSLVSAGSAFVTGAYSFYTMRFLLGVAESGLFPGMLLYLSLWFPARHRAGAVAVFMAAAPLSSVIGSPLSGALMMLPRMLGLSNWQWLYILEALPAIVLGVLTLWVLTDRPEQATWLSGEERDWLIEELRAEGELAAQQPRSEANILRTMRDPRVLALAVVYGGTSAALYAPSVWGPLMIRQFGYSAMAVGWLNALPNLITAIAMVLWARSSDRWMERVWHVVIPCAISAVGFVWMGWAGGAVGVLLALTLASFGGNASKPPLWAVPSQFLSGAGAAAGIAWINSLGNLGGFAGPYLIGWAKTRWGSYSAGVNVVAITLVISAVLMLALRRSFMPPRPSES